MYQSHYFIESSSKKSFKDICLPQEQEEISHKNHSFFQNELKEAQSNFTKELMTLRLEIKMNQK